MNATPKPIHAFSLLITLAMVGCSSTKPIPEPAAKDPVPDPILAPPMRTAAPKPTPIPAPPTRTTPTAVPRVADAPRPGPAGNASSTGAAPQTEGRSTTSPNVSAAPSKAKPAPEPQPVAEQPPPTTSTNMIIGRTDNAAIHRELKTSELNEPIVGVIPQLPATIEMKDVKGVFKMPDDKTLRKLLIDIRGVWRQTGKDNTPDFTEGGYNQSELTFTNTGILRIVRVFGSSNRALRLVRQLDYNLKNKNTLSLGVHRRPDKSTLIAKNLEIPQKGDKPPIAIRPADRELPLDVTFSLLNNRLTIAGKTYTRVKDNR